MPPKAPAKGKEKKKLQKLQEQKIKDSNQHVEAGSGFFEKNNFSKAITSFTSAIEINPENIEAYLQRGRAFKELKEFDKAITDFSKAIELDPDNPEGYAGRGNAFECIEDFEKAIEDYTSVIELRPDDDHAYNMRGNARQAKRITGLKLKNAEFASVISDFTKAIEINPNNYFAFNNRGNSYFDRKDFRSAIEDYTQAINIRADYVYSFIRRGIASYESVLHDEKTKLQKASESELIQETILPPIGKNVEEHKKRWEQEFREVEEQERKQKERLQLLMHALSDFTTALTFDENDTQAYNHRARVYEMLGMHDKAHEDRAKVLEVEAKLAKERR
jgi:tetratricopeptide (TPR) repeat protein